MTLALQYAAIAVFLMFSRVGACLMLLPGYSSIRIAPVMRVLVAFAISLALAPMLMGNLVRIGDPLVQNLVPTIVSEIAVGGMIGLAARVQLMGLHFAAVFVAGAIGLQGLPGVPLDDSDASPALMTVISMAATVVLFAEGLHIVVLDVLIDSYRTLPVGRGVGAALMLNGLLKVASDSSLLALRLAGPCAVYSLIVNLAIGLVGKFSPQFSLYFASLGVVTLGGLFILYLIVPSWLVFFADAYADLLRGQVS